MKKISFLTVLLSFIFGTLTINAQVKSVEILSAESLVESAKITHFDSTETKEDTFYTRIEISSTADFSFSFYTQWVRRIGGGTFADILMEPVVKVGQQSFVRIQATDDTVSAPLLSGTRSVIPKHKPENPTISASIQTITSESMIHKISYSIGYCDSSIITIIAALDSTYQTAVSKKRTRKSDGFIMDTLGPLPSERTFFIKCIITNTVGSAEVKYSFTTSTEPKKPWLKEPLSVQPESEKIVVSGKVNSYGLTGEVWAVYSAGITTGKKSPIVSVTGNGEESFVVNITGLFSNTEYSVKVFAKNSKGETSVDLGKIKTTETTSKVFSLTTTSANATSGTIYVHGSVTIPSGTTATITGGIYEDEECTVSISDQTETFSSSKPISMVFSDIEKGTYWVGFYGTCSDGQFILEPKPVRVEVLYGTGIIEETETKISVYPNPANFFINAPSGQFVILNTTGQIMIEGLNLGSIDVSKLPQGMYVYKNEFGTASFIKK